MARKKPQPAELFKAPPVELAPLTEKYIIAIDPGEKMGLSYGNALDPLGQVSILLNLQIGKAQRHHRSGRIFRALNEAVSHCLGPEEVKNFKSKHHRSFQLIFENSEDITQGKSAVASHARITGVVECWCSMMDVTFVKIKPGDVKFYALGKRSGEKEEMVARAQHFGFEGDNHNVADAFLIYRWGVENLIWHR